MLNQPQLLVASQLFVASGKAGHPFDLAKFSHDTQYAMTTLASLRAHAAEPALQMLIAEVALELANTPPVLSTASMSSAVNVMASEAAPTVTENAPTEGDGAPKRYVGRLR